MDDKRNPYGAPAAKLADPAAKPGSPYKAVGLGLLTDVGGTFVFTMALAFFYAMTLSASGMAPEDITNALTSTGTDSWYFWAASIGGGGFSVLGGYVCARVARQSEYTLGVILGVSSVLIGFLIGDGDRDVGLSVVLSAATVACAVLGGSLGKKSNRRDRAKS